MKKLNKNKITNDNKYVFRKVPCPPQTPPPPPAHVHSERVHNHSRNPVNGVNAVV